MNTQTIRNVAYSFRRRLLSMSAAAVLAVSGTGAAVMPLFLSQTASAAPSTVVVTPSNTQGWGTADTRANGHVNFIPDSTAPLGKGALQLTTDALPAPGQDKAQYLHAANTPLSAVNNLSYYTKQVSTSFPGGDPSYQLPVYLDGTPASFTTLVYEPYQNGTVTPGVWQSWDVDAGQFWSSRTVTSGTCAVVAGGGGAPFYNLATLKTLCPNATVVGFGVNIGSNNPGYNVLADAVAFNDTTYDFEPTLTPTTKDQCKNGGWQTFNTPTFKNQSQCIKYVEQHSHKINGFVHYTAGSLARQAVLNMNTADNNGSFIYFDANHDWYIVDVSSVKTDGDFGWFAGEVIKASNSSWVGNWLFAKVEDNSPDKIWGDFTTQTVAEAGVAAMVNPPSGPFNITSGDLKVD